jgi:hypothetical protein
MKNLLLRDLPTMIWFYATRQWPVKPKVSPMWKKLLGYQD